MGLPLREWGAGGGSFLKHVGIKTLQMAFPERAADGLHEARESGRES